MPERPAVPSEAQDPAAAGRPAAIVLAAGLTLALAAALVGYAVFLVVEWFRETPAEPVNAGLIIGFSLLWGCSLVLCARGLHDRRRWARAPALTSALLVLAIGWLLVHGHGTEVLVGWVVLALSAAATVSLGRPAVGAELH